MAIHVAARRFHCPNHGCTRRTFAERLVDVPRPFGRRTGRLQDLQHHLGLALGGEVGARLAARISAPTSPDTLLRLASACSPTGVVAVPRILGIDDWAELAKVPAAQPLESQRRGIGADGNTARCW